MWSILKNHIFSHSARTPQKKPELHQKLFGVFVGDIVKVCADESKVKILQAEVGGYSTQLMKCVLGKYVKIKHISSNGVKVSWEGREFDLHPDAIEILKPSCMAKESTTNVQSEALFKAIEEGDEMKCCAEISISLLNSTNDEGRTPINAACVVGHLVIVTFLMGFECDLNIWDNDGNFPIHNCAWLDHFEILKYILEQKEDQINKTDRNGKSLLHIAVIRNNKDIVKYLIEMKIDVYIKDNSDKIAYQCKTNMTNPYISRILEDSNPLSLMELPLPSVSMPFGRTNFTNPVARITSNQSDYYQMYLNSSLIEPPRDDYSLTHRSQSDETDRFYFDRHVNMQSINSQMRSNAFLTIQPPSIPAVYRTPREAVDNSRQIINENCHHNAKKVVFLECNHTCCSECAKAMLQCHKCQTKIINKMIIYL